MKIWALSGFLGQPQDWDFLEQKDLQAVDWQAVAWNSLVSWGVEFNRKRSQENQYPQILMGYSLGGRFALHALMDQPQLWQAAIIISAHPGLSNQEERRTRLQQDLKWANRFKTENWKDLMSAWNKQEIFLHDSFHFQRKEADYERCFLVQALIEGSLGMQADLRSVIATLPMPILWLTGSLDDRYCKAAKTLSFAHPHSSWKQIKQAGHRFPWSHSEIFFQIIKNFLNEIEL